VVAAAVKRALASRAAIVAACLMAGLLGVVAVTGHWPVDAPRKHLEAAGILSLPIEQIAHIDFSAAGQETVFTRQRRGEWLVNGAATGPAITGHIDTAVKLLTVSAPRRVLAASEYSPGQLAEYGLDPPGFVLAVATTGGDTTRLGFGEATPARNAQYVRVTGRPELYLLPRDVGEEWQLARDMAGRAGSRLLPVSIARVWAIEILDHGTLYRFERDPDGLWFHHTGQHAHLPGGFVHQADPKLAQLIEGELAALDRLPIARIVTSHPDAAALGSFGLDHPTKILLLYSRDTAGPIARVELGNTSLDDSDRYARVRESDTLVTFPDQAIEHLVNLLQIAGTPS
jgi:Domain of unknown function (DUF4340)